MSFFLKYRFWFLNIIFWFSYYLTQATTSPIFLGFPTRFRFILCFSFIFYILLITASYRYVYKKFHFDAKTLKFTIFQYLVSMVLMLMTDIALRFIINPFFLRNFDPPVSKFGILAEQRESNEISKLLNESIINGQILKLYVIALWLLIYNFYSYYKRLKANEIDKLRVQNELKEAELINLRQQLNPHFLFNALNSIHALVILKKENAAQAVLNLSDLMRYSLNYSKKEFISVDDEINSVRQYLELEKLRFGERLNFTIDIEKNVQQKIILFAVVQTLVENAVKHSVQKNLNAGCIKVSVAEKIGFLQITVKNAGQINCLELKNNDSGIGLENLRLRLQRYYSGNAQFNLQNINTTQVLATLHVPIIDVEY